MVQAIQFSGFKGMNNINGDTELPHDAARRIVNADVLDSGRLRRRKGSTLSLALAGAHSLWSDGVTAYYVLSNILYRFVPGSASVAMGSFNAGQNRISYVKVNEVIYLTCATASASIRNGVLSCWGVETPSSSPTLTASTGVMPAGVYAACVTYITADGRESAPSSIVWITLAADGGITTLSMPNPTSPFVTAKRLYLTLCDGDVFYQAAEVAITDQFTAIGVQVNGNQLRTLHLSVPPFGSALAHYNGWIFIVDAADPRIVWYTEAQDFDHVDKRSNYYQFSPVSLIAATLDGLYVCADQTYFLPQAGQKEAGQRLVLEVGAIANSASTIPNTTDAIWMTSRGPCIGKDGGIVELLVEKSIASGEMANAASMVREKDGIRQFVVVGNNTQASGLVAGG